jgi:pentapeptide MXKDX repeat protein
MFAGKEQEHASPAAVDVGNSTVGDNQMKKFLIATAALSLMCGSAFAQGSTGPAAQQDNMTKPGMTNGSMDKGSMEKGSMSNGTTGTTGMNDGMKKDGMSGGNMKKEGNMSKSGSPSGDTMKKN